MNEHGRSRPLKRLFLRNYAVIVTLSLLAMLVALISADLIMERFVEQMPDYNQMQEEGITMLTSESEGEAFLREYGGWLELLNESGEVVHIVGSKEDTVTHYTQAELYELFDIWRNESGSYVHAFSVQGPNGAVHTLLWKVPEELTGLFSFFGIFIGLFAVLLLVAFYVYTRYSVRQLKRPLHQITEGIKEMEALNYQKRLHFTAEMEFAEIRDAFNKMAERLQRMADENEALEATKRNMLLHLSHDLKTPVTSLLGYSQLLQESPDLAADKRDKYVQYIHDKSRYMSQLIHNLFELAKLEDDHFELQLDEINVTRWLQECAAAFYPDIERSGFVLEVDIPERPMYAKLDKGQMQRVIANLFGNAMKYNSAGTTILVSCAQEDGNAVLCVGDSGVGIPPEIRERVFEEFVSGSEVRNDSTGLGLAICKKVVAHHRGDIRLLHDSVYTTLFRIELPLLN